MAIHNKKTKAQLKMEGNKGGKASYMYIFKVHIEIKFT